MSQPRRQKQRYDHGQTVIVYWREALFQAEYRGYDNFEREESHIVYIPAAGGEQNVSGDEVFADYRTAANQYPRATDHVKGI
jgi:hypothetical protein